MRRHDGEQPSLFPTADLQIPESLKSFRKSVGIIHAIPTRAEHAQSLNSRRLFDACILVAQLDVRKRDKAQVERIHTDRLSPMFEIRITDLARLANIPGKNYERLYAELDRLYEMSFNWNIVGEDETTIWDMQSRFLSERGFGKGQKRGLVRFAIVPSILQMVLEPASWAKLSLQAQHGMGTGPSYALYQNAWRYIGTHAKVTAALPLTIWIELLVGPSRYVVTDTNGEKRAVNYGDFKRRVLTDAVRRVNESPALNHTLKLIEIRSGTRVSRLQFKFIPKEQASLGLPLTWSDDLIRTLKVIGLSESEIEDMSQAHSYEVAIESVNRLKSAEDRMKASGRPITSRKAYFNGILNNIASGAAEGELTDGKLEEEALALEAQRQAVARSERRKQEFSKYQGERFAERIFALPEDERQAIFTEFENSAYGPKIKPLLNKGWHAKNIGALSMLRTWMGAEKSDVLEKLLDRPEDKSFEAWVMWKLEAAEDTGAGSPP